MPNPSLRTTIMFGSLMSALCACGASAPPTAPREGDVHAIEGPASPAQTPALPMRTLDEIDADELMDKQAETACRNGRFSEFFEAFVRSPSVARHYSADRVTLIRGTSQREIRGAGYSGAPIALMDFRWVTASSATRGAPFERVALKIDQSGDNRVLVEWRPVEYGPPGPDAEDGEILRQTGPAGALLFAPTDHCWELVEDRIRTEGA